MTKERMATTDEVQAIKLSQAVFQEKIAGEVEIIRRDIASMLGKLTDLVDMRDQVHDNKKDIETIQANVTLIKRIIYTIGMFIFLAVIGAILRLVIIQ